MAKQHVYTVTSRTYGKKLRGTKVYLSGFSSIPAEFTKPDRGFPFGKTLLEILGAQFKTFRLVVCNKGKPKLGRVKRTSIVTLPISEFKTMSSSRYPLRKDIDQRVVWNMLASNFPKVFTGNRGLYAYSKGMFRSLISTLSLRQISQDDLYAISEFIATNPQIMGRSGSLKQKAAAARAPVVRALVSDLDDGIRQDKKEQYWQEFCKRHFLFLNDEYVQMIEKQNLGIAIKIPDFLLVTSDGYVDVLELKTPGTTLLKYDSSHDNYYWSSDVSQAISQAENYLDVLNKNAHSITDYLRRQGMEVDVIRPRAYIIAGNSQSFGKKEMVRQFRLLSRPMANIEILTYSNLLARAKNKLMTIEKSVQLKPSARGKSKKRIKR